jgi:hypothetical protein
MMPVDILVPFRLASLLGVKLGKLSPAAFVDRLNSSIKFYILDDRRVCRLQS